MLVGAIDQYLEGLRYCLSEAEVPLIDCEGLVFQLGQVEQVIDQVLYQALGENLLVQGVQRLGMEELHLVEERPQVAVLNR